MTVFSPRTSQRHNEEGVGKFQLFLGAEISPWKINATRNSNYRYKIIPRATVGLVLFVFVYLTLIFHQFRFPAKASLTAELREKGPPRRPSTAR